MKLTNGRLIQLLALLAPGYWVGTGIADNIWGPYQKQPQVFLGGHIAVFTGPDGKEWFSYRGDSALLDRHSPVHAH